MSTSQAAHEEAVQRHQWHGEMLQGELRRTTADAQATGSQLQGALAVQADAQVGPRLSWNFCCGCIALCHALCSSAQSAFLTANCKGVFLHSHVGPIAIALDIAVCMHKKEHPEHPKNVPISLAKMT